MSSQLIHQSLSGATASEVYVSNNLTVAGALTLTSTTPNPSPPLIVNSTSPNNGGSTIPFGYGDNTAGNAGFTVPFLTPGPYSSAGGGWRQQSVVLSGIRFTYGFAGLPGGALTQVKLDIPFSAPPVVFLTPGSSSPLSPPNIVQPIFETSSLNQFVVGNGTAGNGNFSWLAIGPA